MILVGVNEKETPVIPIRMNLGEIELKGSLAWTHDDFRVAVDMLASSHVAPQPLLWDTIPLADIQTRGFEQLAATRSLIKLLVRP